MADTLVEDCNQSLLKKANGSALPKLESGMEKDVAEDVTFFGGNKADDQTTTAARIPKWRLAVRGGAMYMGFLTMGMAHALIGATLLELQIQTGVEMGELSLLFTWSFFGRLISSFFASVVFDRIHPELQLGLASLLCFVSTGAVPFSNNYITVAFTLTIQGFCSGFMCAGCSAHAFYLWGSKTGPYLQALHFIFSVGCAITPVIVEPYLTPNAVINSTVINATTAGPLLNEVILESDVMFSVGDAGIEESMILENVISSLHMNNNTDLQSTAATVEKVFGRYHPGTFYPYVIVAVCQLAAVVYFLAEFIAGKCQFKRVTGDVKMVTAKSNLVLIGLFVLALFCSCGVEIICSGFLYTYAVKKLLWDVTTANYLATMYWVVFSVSRAIAIPITRFVRPRTMLAVVLPIMAVSTAVMAGASEVHPVIMWLTSAGISMALSVQVATLFVFAGEFLQISGMISGIFMASMFGGGMVLPGLTGFLCKQLGDMVWFTYVQVIGTALLIVTFAVICVYVEKVGVHRGVTAIDSVSVTISNDSTESKKASLDSYEMQSSTKEDI